MRNELHILFDARATNGIHCTDLWLLGRLCKNPCEILPHLGRLPVVGVVGAGDLVGGLGQGGQQVPPREVVLQTQTAHQSLNIMRS